MLLKLGSFLETLANGPRLPCGASRGSQPVRSLLRTISAELLHLSVSQGKPGAFFKWVILWWLSVTLCDSSCFPAASSLSGGSCASWETGSFPLSSF